MFKKERAVLHQREGTKQKTENLGRYGILVPTGEQKERGAKPDDNLCRLMHRQRQ